MDENHLMDVIKVYKHINLNKEIIEQENELESNEDNDLPEVANPDIQIIPFLYKEDSHKTPRATLYEHNETPGESIYWEPHVQEIPIPVEGTYFDTLDEAIDMYTNYAEIEGFEVKKSGQRLTKSGVVKHKDIMCNKEGVPKAATNKIGATRAHNLLSSMKGGYEYVHGTTHDFKNHQRDVNVFIGESDWYGYQEKDENKDKTEHENEKSARIRVQRCLSYLMGQSVTHFIGCETVIVRDNKPNDNRILNTKNEKEQEKETETLAETVIEYKVILPKITCDYKINHMNHMPRFLSYVILISKDGGKMGAFVEKLKLTKDEVRADVPNPPSRNTGYVIGGERLKSEREKELKVKVKPMKVCGYCNKKTNEHTKITCPKNSKARKKKKATSIIDV
ncbi:hypothetical protein Tco_0337381 [Tanacetum coccineum]